MSRRTPWIGTLTLTLVLAGGAAHAEEPRSSSSEAARREAQALFAQALEKANAGDSRGALVAFRSAYERFPSFRVLYNIGQICVRLDDASCSIRAYEQYLRDGGVDVPAARRSEIEAALPVLRRRVAKVTITSNVAGAEVRVDDDVIGRTPLADPVLVNAGQHSVVVSRDDKKVERSMKLEGIGESVTLELPLPKDDTAATPAPGPAPAVAEEAVPPEPTSGRARPVPIVPWAVTGGLGVATAIAGAVAATTYASFTDTRDRFGVTRGEIDDAQSTARGWFLVAGVFGTLTLVSAGVAGYLTFLAPPAAAQQQKTSSTAIAPRVSLGPRGVLLEGVLP